MQPSALRLVPQYHERVWGGQRLKPATPPIGEAWIVYEENRVASGPLVDRTLADVVASAPSDILGRRVITRTGERFPLLIKLLDTNDWLSLQVHPNDEQARRLEGPDEFGKTEAWHMLETEPGAKVIYGLRPGIDPTELDRRTRDGTIVDLVQYVEVHSGDTMFTPAGTIHALGPGLLLYEVQQTSDITYRVFDWNRPLSAGRALHIDQSIAVMGTEPTPPIHHERPVIAGQPQMLVECPYFRLDLIGVEGKPAEFATEGETFHTLTCTQGTVDVESHDWHETLQRFDSIVVPASSHRYTISASSTARLLKASVE